MHQENGRYCYSPSDLHEFLASPFATWMSRYVLDSPDPVQPDPDPLALTTLAERGRKQEQACLAHLRQAGRAVYRLPADAGRVEATITAMQAGQEVIYRGGLQSGVVQDARPEYFLARPDFLVRTAGESALGHYRYEAWDVTLAPQPSPAHLIQLCCSTDLLQTAQEQRPDSMLLWLGSGARRRFRTADFIYYYLALKQAFLAYMQQFDPAAQPGPEPGGDYGRWTAQAAQILERADHLSRVANITVSQIQKLNAAGITTLTSLAVRGQ